MSRRDWHATRSVGESTMRLLIRIVAVLAAVSVLGTVWFVAGFAAAAMFALPLVVLLLPRTRILFATPKSNAPG
jgi:hypothetical protein